MEKSISPILMKFGQNYPDLDPAGNFDQVSLRLDKNCGFFNKSDFSQLGTFLNQSLCKLL